MTQWGSEAMPGWNRRFGPWPHCLVAASLTIAFAVRVSAHDPITTKVTWSKEVVRIVDTRCLGCHAPGGSAPMALATYDQARPWAKAIREQVVSRRMPMWPAARGFGHFSNDPSLSPFEIDLIAAWADGGAPKGDDKDLPARPVEPEIPKPDLLLRIPARTLPPAGERVTRVVLAPFKTDRWISGWEFTPNDPAIVEAQFTLDGTGEPLGAWVPPDRRTMFPAASGELLPRDRSILVTLTYRSAREQQDFPVEVPAKGPEIGLYLLAKAPRLTVGHRSVKCGEVMATVGGPTDPTVFALRVTSGTAGSSVGVSLVRPDGPAWPLLWVRAATPDYQPTYRLPGSALPGAGEVATETRGSGPCGVVVDFVK